MGFSDLLFMAQYQKSKCESLKQFFLFAYFHWVAYFDNKIKVILNFLRNIKIRLNKQLDMREISLSDG